MSSAFARIRWRRLSTLRARSRSQSWRVVAAKLSNMAPPSRPNQVQAVALLLLYLKLNLRALNSSVRPIFCVTRKISWTRLFSATKLPLMSSSWRILSALKPGGRFVVSDHSARIGDGATVGKSLHRIEESTKVGLQSLVV